MDPIEVCVQAQTDMFAHGLVETADRWTTPDVVSHSAPPDAPSGRAGLRSVIEWIHSGLDDVAYDVHDAFACGDRVVLLCTMSGTHARPWMGHEPSGRSFAVEHIHVFRVAGDRIAEHWGARDDLGMVRQLGFLETASNGPHDGR